MNRGSNCLPHPCAGEVCTTLPDVFSNMGFGDQTQVAMLSWPNPYRLIQAEPSPQPCTFCDSGKAHLVSVNQKETEQNTPFLARSLMEDFMTAFSIALPSLLWGSGGLGVKTGSAEGHRNQHPQTGHFGRREANPLQEAVVCSGITPHSRGMTPIPAIVPHTNRLTLEEAKRGEVARVTFN